MQTILVVDDDPGTRAFLTDFLVGEGYGVRSAPDGLAALGAVAAECPDLILADVWMPGLDGFGLLERLDERTIPVPTVLMSGTHFLYRDVRAVAWVDKPIDLAGLAATLAQALRPLAIADPVSASPAVAALHDARTALTIVSGRVALAQRHVAHGDAGQVVAADLALVQPQVARAAEAIQTLADAAGAGPGAIAALADTPESP